MSLLYYYPTSVAHIYSRERLVICFDTPAAEVVEFSCGTSCITISAWHALNICRLAPFVRKCRLHLYASTADGRCDVSGERIDGRVATSTLKGAYGIHNAVLALHRHTGSEVRRHRPVEIGAITVGAGGSTIAFGGSDGRRQSCRQRKAMRRKK